MVLLNEHYLELKAHYLLPGEINRTMAMSCSTVLKTFALTPALFYGN